MILEQLRLRLTGTVSDLRALVRSPSLRGALPGVARRVLPALLVAGIFTSAALPLLLDRVLPRIYPDVTVEKKVLGFLPRRATEPDPRIPVRKGQILVLAWVLTVGGACVAVVRGLRSAPGNTTVVKGRTEPTKPTSAVSGRAAAGEAGRYVLEQELGRGGMGVVRVARDTVLDRRVALKELVIPPEARGDFVTRFRQEARALARLAHPNIVQVHDLLADGDRFRLVMELAEGGSLADRLAASGRLPAAEAASVIADVARGLAFAHEQGVVHRDVKPANILFAKEGVPKIADFGLAKLGGGEGGMTLEGTVLGSPAYLSPEQAGGGSADERSDAYSLGVTLYEALTGTRPFEGEVLALLARHLREEPTPVRERSPEVPEELAGLVSAMMAKDPAQRPGMRRIIAALDDIGRTGRGARETRASSSSSMP